MAAEAAGLGASSPRQRASSSAMPGATGSASENSPFVRLHTSTPPSSLAPAPFSDYACPTTVFSIILATFAFIDNLLTDIACATQQFTPTN